MVIHLWRLPRIRIPRGTGWWLLLMIWVMASIFLLWADAPGAVPGGGPERLLVYGYRLAWYLACGVVFLWVGNASEKDLPTLKVIRLMSWMFVVTVAGGLLGLLAPTLEFTSLTEFLLPQSLSSNGYIQTLVHPAAADLSSILGYEEYRPIAPFAYANSWGSNLSLFLPFFLLACFGKAAGWRRFMGPIVLVAAATPIVYSMNRGLWLSLGVGAALLLLRLALKGRWLPLVVVGATAILATAIFAASPLSDLAGERLAHPHSNERRSELMVDTVTSTFEGSPIAGFGSTRDVQGSFASIAGGGTADCPACEVPPYGTQGQLWLVIFSQGLVGAAFFLLFFLAQARNHWRCRSPLEFTGMTLLVFLALQMFIYDMLGMPLYTVMIGIALMWRERRDITFSVDSGRDLSRMLGTVTRHKGTVVSCVLAGTLAGGAFTFLTPAVYASEVSLELEPTPLYLYGSASNSESDMFTVDTEAALVLSQASLSRLKRELPLRAPANLRSRIQITAMPHTRVLRIKYTDTDKSSVKAVANALATSYLEVRSDYLSQRRENVRRSLQKQLTELAQKGLDVSYEETLLGSQTELTTAGEIHQALARLPVSGTNAGNVLRSATAVKTRGQPEVPVVSSALMGLLAGLIIVQSRELWLVRQAQAGDRGGDHLPHERTRDAHISREDSAAAGGNHGAF